MKRNKNSFHRTQDACPIWHHAHRNRKEDAQSTSLLERFNSIFLLGDRAFKSTSHLERFNEIFPNGSFQSVVPPPPPPFVWGFFLPSQLNPAPFVIYRGSRWMTH